MSSWHVLSYFGPGVLWMQLYWNILECVIQLFLTHLMHQTEVFSFFYFPSSLKLTAEETRLFILFLEALRKNTTNINKPGRNQMFRSWKRHGVSTLNPDDVIAVLVAPSSGRFLQLQPQCACVCVCVWRLLSVFCFCFCFFPGQVWGESPVGAAERSEVPAERPVADRRPQRPGRDQRGTESRNHMWTHFSFVFIFTWPSFFKFALVLVGFQCGFGRFHVVLSLSLCNSFLKCINNIFKCTNSVKNNLLK